MRQHSSGVMERVNEMKSNENMVKLIKRQIDIENEHVKHIAELEKEVDSAAARLLLLEMKFDSQKHAGILEGILEVLAGIPPSKPLWDYPMESYVDRITVRKALENHVKMEADVLGHV
jgi:rubrerythrin